MNLNKLVGKRIFPNARFPLSEVHNKDVCKLAVGSDLVRSKFLNDLKLDKVPSDSLVVNLLEKDTGATVGYRSCGC
ncbi:unnamed protein product [Cylindrotheca closterium]|uniref:Uncharacterized protein n=1 Tax=Cylindrotheca closterium TaxID=2856 RepID=A0AAD2CRN3_9STRA|nr:unnamed protein product [Cylindrotheca closterium]